jgi:hypothetical protein
MEAGIPVAEPVSARNRTMRDCEIFCAIAERVEKMLVGAGHERLAADMVDEIEKGCAPV